MQSVRIVFQLQAVQLMPLFEVVLSSGVVASSSSSSTSRSTGSGSSSRSSSNAANNIFGSDATAGSSR